MGNVALPMEPIMDTDDILVSIEDPIAPTVIQGATFDRPEFIVYVAEPQEGERIVNLSTLITASYPRNFGGVAVANTPAIRHQSEFTEDEIRNLAKRYNDALPPAEVRYTWVRITTLAKSIVPVELHRLSDDTTERATPVSVAVDYKDGTSELKLAPGKITQYYRWHRMAAELSLTFNLYTAPVVNYLDRIRLAVNPADGASDPFAGSLPLEVADGGLILSNGAPVTRRVGETIIDGLELLNAYVGN